MADQDNARSEDSHAGERLFARLLFFSDAVFAIVLTLLVLELRPPEGHTSAELIEGLRRLTGPFIAFTTSFALVSVFWIAHMSIMRVARAFNWTVAVFNLVFLFTITLMPFASSVLGENGQQGANWDIYCAALIAASLAQSALLIVIAITGANFGVREFWFRLVRALSPGIAFAVGLGLNLTGYALYSFWSPALIAVIFLLAQLVLGPRRARA